MSVFRHFYLTFTCESLKTVAFPETSLEERERLGLGENIFRTCGIDIRISVRLSMDNRLLVEDEDYTDNYNNVTVRVNKCASVIYFTLKPLCEGKCVVAAAVKRGEEYIAELVDHLG